MQKESSGGLGAQLLRLKITKASVNISVRHCIDLLHHSLSSGSFFENQFRLISYRLVVSKFDQLALIYLAQEIQSQLEKAERELSIRQHVRASLHQWPHLRSGHQVVQP